MLEIKNWYKTIKAYVLCDEVWSGKIMDHENKIFNFDTSFVDIESSL